MVVGCEVVLDSVVAALLARLAGPDIPVVEDRCLNDPVHEFELLSTLLGDNAAVVLEEIFAGQCRSWKDV